VKTTGMPSSASVVLSVGASSIPIRPVSVLSVLH
jgi:hypothetical protein